MQMIMSHALGDAISPAIVGRIAVALTDVYSLETQYLGLQRALFLDTFVCALGGFLFLTVTLYLVKAKNNVLKAVQGTVPLLLFCSLVHLLSPLTVRHLDRCKRVVNPMLFLQLLG
ncbi:unnamed protein product [Trichobilharzia regenti]|nr:unnamed protein product [Trichobilharzia regenti]